MISNLDFAQNDFLLKEGPRQQSVDIHARNCISFNFISEKDFTRPLPGHSAATLFKEILTEIIFCKLISFPTTFQKNLYTILFWKIVFKCSFYNIFLSGCFHKMKWIQFWAVEDYFLPGCLLCWQMRMSTTSRSGHQQEIAPEKWLSYYFRTLTEWGKEEWQRNISQRFNNPRHFSGENFNSQLSYFNLRCLSQLAPAVACKYFRLISSATHPEPEPERGGGSKFHSLFQTSSPSLQTISRQLIIMGIIHYH